MDQIDAAEVGIDDISIERCRELLGDEAVALSDDEIDRIRWHGETMARILIEVFLADRSTIQ